MFVICINKLALKIMKKTKWLCCQPNISALTPTAPDFFAVESFLILPNITKLLCDRLLMILQVQLASDVSFH